MGIDGSLRVRLLGGLAVEGLTENELGSRKGRTLLKVLALAAGEPVTVERLAEVLWGDEQPARPAEQVGVLVSRLRGVLGADRIVRGDAGYRLRVDWLDFDELRRRVDEAAAALEVGRVGVARAAAAAAVAMARGPLLPEEDGEWVEGPRAAAAATVGRAQHLIAEAASSTGDHGGAAAAAEAALLLDPYDEAALRALMRAHAGAGRPASALAAYVRVRDRIVEDLGVDPTPETEALHDALVLGANDAAAAAWPSGGTGASTPPLAGRSAELAILDARLEAVGRTGRAEAVLVRGDAGIGKSATVAAWIDGLGDRAAVLRGRGDELGRDLPLQPIADALSDHLRLLGDTDAAALLGAEAPAVAALLGWSGPAAATTVSDAEIGQAQLFAALLAVVERTGAGRPAVLVIEDLHLVGASTQRWLAFGHRRGRGVMVIATSRTGGPDLPGATEIVVGPLDRAAAATLLGDLDPARVDELHARSDGNPLFLLALAASPEGELPESVRDVVDTQAASLGDAGPAVRAAAVLGSAVDLDLLAEVLRAPAVAVLGHLESAVAAGLLVEHGDGLAFHHELVREALERSVSTARRALVHRDAARALAARPSPDPLAVAVHARLGGDDALAVDAYEQAAGQAYGRFDTDAAIAHLDLAIELGGSASAYGARARVRMATIDLEAAAVDAAAAVSLGGGAAALEIAAWVAYYRRRHDEAKAFADEAVRQAGEDVALRGSALAVAGRVRHARGDLAGARERLTSAVGAPRAVQGVVDVWLGYVQVHEGDAEAALATLERPLVSPDDLAHPFAGLHGRFGRAMALGYLGRIEEGLQVCDDLDLAVTRTGAVGARFLGPSANVRAWLLRHSGAPEEADERNRATLEVTAGADGSLRSEALAEYHYVAVLDLADGCVLRGDLDGAAAHAARLGPVDTWNGTMAWHQRHRLGLLRARLAWHAGDGDTAAELAAAVAADAAGRGARRYELLARAWVSLAGGDGDLDRVSAVVGGLDRAAALEGWRLVSALADHFDVDAWHREAERRVRRLVAAAGRAAPALSRVVTGVLG